MQDYARFFSGAATRRRCQPAFWQSISLATGRSRAALLTSKVDWRSKYLGAEADCPRISQCDFAQLSLSGRLDPYWGEIALKTQQVLDACLQSARAAGRMVAV